MIGFSLWLSGADFGPDDRLDYVLRDLRKAHYLLASKFRLSKEGLECISSL